MDHQYKRSDRNPGAVINTDKSQLDNYHQRKKQAERLNNLEEKMSNIEGMLSKILDKISKDS